MGSHQWWWYMHSELFHTHYCRSSDTYSISIRSDRSHHRYRCDTGDASTLWSFLYIYDAFTKNGRRVVYWEWYRYLDSTYKAKRMIFQFCGRETNLSLALLKLYKITTTRSHLSSRTGTHWFRTQNTILFAYAARTQHGEIKNATSNQCIEIESLPFI